MSVRRYVLNDSNDPIQVERHPEGFFSDPRRVVAEDELSTDLDLRTHFTGIEHIPHTNDPKYLKAPLLFESLLIEGNKKTRLASYRSWDEAADEHPKLLTALKRQRQL